MNINVTWVLLGIAALMLVNLVVSWLQTRSLLKRYKRERREQWAAFKDEIETRRDVE